MSQIPSLQTQGYLLCPIPTSPERIRKRGFDHCQLISKLLQADLGLNSARLLERSTNARQVGSTRAERFKQMELEFKLVRDQVLKDKKIMLVDDVMTSGATLASAARILKKAGAKEVSAIVFARK
jgi:ComF family protein